MNDSKMKNSPKRDSFFLASFSGLQEFSGEDTKNSQNCTITGIIL